MKWKSYPSAAKQLQPALVVLSLRLLASFQTQCQLLKVLSRQNAKHDHAQDFVIGLHYDNSRCKHKEKIVSFPYVSLTGGKPFCRAGLTVIVCVRRNKVYMEYEFENFGKFIQRVNLALIFFCTFSIVTAIQITQFNKNLTRAESIKTSIVTSQSSIFKHIDDALKSGSDTAELIWSTRFEDDDAKNLINHEIELGMLVEWFDMFWKKEKNQEASGQLQMAFFELSNISDFTDEIQNITGNKAKTIEAAINSLDSYLVKREIKSIKLPLLGTEVEVSLLINVVPITQALLLLVISGYLVIVSSILSSKDNVKELLSNTVLYVANYSKKDMVHNLFKLPRLIPSTLMFFTLYVYGLFSIFYWQFWLTLMVVCAHIGAAILLDRKIISILPASSNALQTNS